MLIDSHNFRRVILAAGKTDLRKGIDGLAALVKSRFDLDPFEPDVLFLFCGTSKRKIKGLLWEGDGFLLLYKRTESGCFQWPRNTDEAMSLDAKQLSDLLHGFSVVSTIRPVQGVRPL